MRSLKQLTDEELLKSMKDGDEKAFAALFERYWEKIHRFALSKTNSQTATEEIVQDLFINLWDRRENLSIQNFSHYIFTSAKYKCLKHINSLMIHRKYSAYYLQHTPLQDEATNKMVEFEELMGALEDGIEKLPEKSKKVFRLNRLEGKTIREIASALNLSEKAIEYHLTRSLKELRVHLKNFIFSLLILLQ